MNFEEALIRYHSLLGIARLALGLIISVQAFRAYNRSNNNSMLYFSVGLTLILVVPILLVAGIAIAQEMLSTDPVWREIIRSTVRQVTILIGLCILVYGLYAKPNQS